MDNNILTVDIKLILSAFIGTQNFLVKKVKIILNIFHIIIEREIKGVEFFETNYEPIFKQSNADDGRIS